MAPREARDRRRRERRRARRPRPRPRSRRWRATPLAAAARSRRALRPSARRARRECARILTSEVGKPLAQARGEVKGTLGRIDFFLAETEKRASRDRSSRRPDGGMTRGHRPRAARRRRQHLGLELPLFRRQQRLRPGAPDRQRRPLQAFGVRGADRPADRPAAGRKPACPPDVFMLVLGDRRDRRRAARADRSTASSSPAPTRPARRSRTRSGRA